MVLPGLPVAVEDAVGAGHSSDSVGDQVPVEVSLLWEVVGTVAVPRLVRVPVPSGIVTTPVFDVLDGIVWVVPDGWLAVPVEVPVRVPVEVPV